MKQNMLASIVAYALMWAWLMYIKGETMPSQILDIADLHLPEKPVSVVPDFKNGTPLGVWSEAFVFSAKYNRDGKFDLHCKYMTAENVFRRHADITDYSGYVVVTGCVRATVSVTPCYLNGFVLNCAKEQTEEGQYCHCDMYLLRREGNKIKSLPFSEQAKKAKMFPYMVEESLFRSGCSNSNCLASVFVFKKEREGAIPKWSIIETKVDLNSFSNLSERVLMSYESHEPRGLSM